MGSSAYSPLLALFTLAPKLRRANSQTLSACVPVRAEGYDARYYDILFGDLLHRYRERLGEKDIDILELELPRLRSLVAIVRPAGCAAFAAFAESASGVLEIIKLPLPTPERLEVGEPLLAPVLRQIEALPAALVVVADKECAEIFGVILDDIFQVAVLTGQEVKHSRAGGTSALSNQRKADNRARSNLASVAKKIAREISSGAYDRLYVAGPQEARAQLEALIPASLRDVIAGHLGASLDSATLEADLRHQILAHRIAA